MLVVGDREQVGLARPVAGDRVFAVAFAQVPHGAHGCRGRGHGHGAGLALADSGTQAAGSTHSQVAMPTRPTMSRGGAVAGVGAGSAIWAAAWAARTSAGAGPGPGPRGGGEDLEGFAQGPGVGGRRCAGSTARTSGPPPGRSGGSGTAPPSDRRPGGSTRRGTRRPRCCNATQRTHHRRRRLRTRLRRPRRHRPRTRGCTVQRVRVSSRVTAQEGEVQLHRREPRFVDAARRRGRLTAQTDADRRDRRQRVIIARARGHPLPLLVGPRRLRQADPPHARSCARATLVSIDRADVHRLDSAPVMAS